MLSIGPSGRLSDPLPVSLSVSQPGSFGVGRVGVGVGTECAAYVSLSAAPLVTPATHTNVVCAGRYTNKTSFIDCKIP